MAASVVLGLIADFAQDALLASLASAHTSTLALEIIAATAMHMAQGQCPLLLVLTLADSRIW